MIAKGGIVIIAISFVIFVACFVVWNIQRNALTLILMLLTGLIFLFNMYFFRDPNRTAPEDDRAIISAADGRVVGIAEEFEPGYFNERVWRVSIFLSIFDVHVNRAPISGTVNHLEYYPGKFLAAYKDKASLENERMEIGIVSRTGAKVMFKQIAGIIARRVVCDLHEGQLVKAGERMGMIRYGSRVDMFFPLSAKVLVNMGQKVSGGETIIATFTEENDQVFQEAKIDEVPELEGA